MFAMATNGHHCMKDQSIRAVPSRPKRSVQSACIVDVDKSAGSIYKRDLAMCEVEEEEAKSVPHSPLQSASSAPSSVKSSNMQQLLSLFSGPWKFGSFACHVHALGNQFVCILILRPLDIQVFLLPCPGPRKFSSFVFHVHALGHATDSFFLRF